MSAKAQCRRRRQKARRVRGQTHGHWGDDTIVVLSPELLDVIGLFEPLPYEITSEPLDPGPKFKRLPEADKAMIKAAEDRYLETGRHDVAELERLVERFPDQEKLWNYLAIAYEQAGRYEDAVRLIRETHERFPDYLFARVCYANLCILEGRLQKVPALLGEELMLHRLYPNRRRFHRSEFVAYHVAVAQFLLAIGDKSEAMCVFRLLKEVAPDDPRIRALRQQFQPVRGAFSRMWKRGARGPRKDGVVAASA